MMRLPKKITPCPIIEAVVEIRFSSLIPPDAVFGIVYEGFKDVFPNKPSELPILQLPSQIRNSDPNLIYKPQYRFEDKNILLQIGPKSVSIVNTGEYIGWSAFSPKIRECCKRIESLNIIKEKNRFGLRYVNLFEGQNVFDRLNMGLVIQSQQIIEDKAFINVEKKAGKFDIVFKISNSAKIQQNGEKVTGSLIDVDVFLMEGDKKIVFEIEDILEEAHNTEKEAFFGLLKDGFIASLNPEY